MTDEQPWTVGRLLNWTTDFLRDKGADSPRLDAEVLLAHARGCQRIELYTAFEEEAAEPLREAFRELVRRRAGGTPVAYLVGHREFFSMSFRVTSDVLIPRPESELLVVRVLDLAKTLAKGRALRIADVGTGSGILAVCCAKYLPTSTVTAIDISPMALAVAQANAEQHGVADRIEFVASDLFAKRQAPEACNEEHNIEDYDIIISNPPYVASAELAGLDADVRDHEPHLALDGGEQGTEVIERLIPQAAERLKPGGWLLMEVGPNNAALVEQLVADSGLALQDTIADLAGHPRVVQAEKS
ncbi:MAG: peptide chain release factor N(5)-glutamine methyltransferase [Planctomycetes bacterium]|nr:peptide chain release factor N(5)-glutamine methyltransferase [Planctomycetota bacterium]